MTDRGRRRNDRWLNVAEEESAELMMGQDSRGHRLEFVQMDDLNGDGSRKSAAVRNLEQNPFGARKHRGLYYIFAAAVLLVIVIAGLSQISSSQESTRARPIRQRSNGTHLFNPTTIFVSLDGFHPHYVSEKRSPHLARLVNNGFATPYITPAFPSQTFPNHWTLATGLYPVNHGIVGNSFWDPILKRQFKHTSPESLDLAFWGGEPLWATAKKNNRKSAVHMWPGSEVDFKELSPNFVDKFNKTEELRFKRDRVLNWLDLPIEERPELIMAYVPTVDTVGHKYGISGPEVEAAITQVDDLIGQVIAGLAERNLTEVVNLVVVSDHGMAPTSDDRLVFLDDYIDMSRVKTRQGWPLAGLRYDYREEEAPAYKALHDGIKEGASVYWSNQMPEEWNFSSKGRYGHRLAPFYVVPDLGWSILTHAAYKEMGMKYNLPGVHGYDTKEALMRGFFAASGPGFPTGRYEPFANVNVYALICESLGMRSAPSDGTTELTPLKETFVDNYPDAIFPLEYMRESLFVGWPKEKKSS